MDTPIIDTAVFREMPDFLNFYEQKGIQDIIEDGFIEKINPISGHEARHGGTLKFNIPGSLYYINPDKTYVVMKLKLIGNDGTGSGAKGVELANTGSTKLTVVNNLAHSLFKSVRVKLNGQYITLNQTDYAYLAYLQILLNASKISQETYFNTCGWIRDTAGEMDSMIGSDLNSSENKGAYRRRLNLFTGDSNAVGEFVFKPHTSLSFCGKCLVPFVELEYEFTRNDNPEFYLMYGSASGTFKIEIEEAYMVIQKYKCNSLFNESIEKVMPKYPLKYKLKESMVNTYTIPQSVRNYNNDMLFHGKVPHRIIIGFVSTQAYNGQKDRNPFNFQHCKVESFRLLKNGLEYPVTELITKFDTTPYTVMNAYNRLMMSFGSDYNRDCVAITPYEFSHGYYLVSYLMSPDQESGSDISNLSNKPSSLKLEIRFSQNLTTNIQMIVYYETESTVSVDFARNIVVQH